MAVQLTGALKAPKAYFLVFIKNTLIYASSKLMERMLMPSLKSTEGDE